MKPERGKVACVWSLRSKLRAQNDVHLLHKLGRPAEALEVCHDAAASHPVETGATSSIHAVGKQTLVNSPFLVALPDFLLHTVRRGKEEVLG